MPTDVVPHISAMCDDCSNIIFGVRYKCGHCRTFDLCNKCEASPSNAHDPTHVFLKIKCPLADYGPFRAMLPYPLYEETDATPQTENATEKTEEGAVKGKPTASAA